MFHVGMSVVYVNDGLLPDDDMSICTVEHPVKGQVYTIARIWPYDMILAVEELPCHDGNRVYGWQFCRWRPVVTTDISIFQAMLVPTPKEKVEA